MRGERGLKHSSGYETYATDSTDGTLVPVFVRVDLVE